MYSLPPLLISALLLFSLLPSPLSLPGLPLPFCMTIFHPIPVSEEKNGGPAASRHRSKPDVLGSAKLWRGPVSGGPSQNWGQPCRVSQAPVEPLTMPNKSCPRRKINKLPISLERSPPEHIGWLWKALGSTPSREMYVSLMREILQEDAVGAIRAQTDQIRGCWQVTHTFQGPLILDLPLN